MNIWLCAHLVLRQTILANIKNPALCNMEVPLSV